MQGNYRAPLTSKASKILHQTIEEKLCVVISKTDIYSLNNDSCLLQCYD